MADQNLKMVRGDTLSFGVEIEGVDTLDEAYFTVKKDLNNVEPLFQKTLSDGIWKDSDTPDGALYGVRVAPEDTADLVAGNYWYDLQIGVNSDVYTILIGVLTIQQDVTEIGG